jgi:feruloyl esterase
VRLAILLLTANAALAADCGQLAELTLPATTVQTAETITSGSFQPPAGQPLRNLPPFCRVAGIIRPSSDSEIHFETWMPVSNWNGKFQGIGNGGFAGSIGYGGLAGAIQNGYATAATDTGHQAAGQDARWALNHPEKIIDYGWRAIHETALKGKALTEAFYGKKPTRSYFNSCSNGGRQALMEAQRFPEDYDGIIAGAPANYFTRTVSLHMVVNKALLTTDAGYIPAAKLKAIQDAALTACDTRDKVRDGVIEEPLACRPDFSRLACSGAETDACLTTAQIAALKTIHNGLRDRKGKLLFPPYSPGGEADAGGWGPWLTGAGREKSAAFAFGTQFYKNMVYSDPNWDYRTFDLDRDLKAAEQKLGPVLNAVDPDLRRFHARGGKLILYHGWCDAAIPAANAVNYYQSVEKKLGRKTTREFVRLFMAPGVQHCGGGAGPNTFGQGGPRGGDPGRDLNAALERWVESGVAPDRVVAAKMNAANAVERTRPLCAWPKTARWNGSGSTDEAANFHCR